MSGFIKGLTRGGAEWTPEFVTAVDPTTCIGCGRCYKVCSRDVFNLVDRADLIDDDDLDDDEDDAMMVMTVRITSYNVCYTKLLRYSDAATMALSEN